MGSIYIDFNKKIEEDFQASLDFSHHLPKHAEEIRDTVFEKKIDMLNQNAPSLMPNSFRTRVDGEKTEVSSSKSYLLDLKYEDDEEVHVLFVDLEKVVPVDYIFLSAQIFEELVLTNVFQCNYSLNISFESAEGQWINALVDYNLENMLDDESDDIQKLIYLGIFAQHLKFELRKICKQAIKEEKEVMLNFTHASDFDENGMIYFIGTDGKRGNHWRNPITTNKLRITKSHEQMFSDSMEECNLIDRSCIQNTYFGGSSPQYFIIDLGPKTLAQVTKYTMRHGFSNDNSFLFDFTFCGSTDGLIWDELDSNTGTCFYKRNQAVTLQVKQNSTKSYRYFRILQYDNYLIPGSNTGDPYLCLNGLELYGKLVFNRSNLRFSDFSFSVLSHSQNVRKFKYSEDFDTNGIIYWIGSNGLTESYKNPSISGKLEVTLSNPVYNPNMSKHNVVSRHIVDTFWGETTPQWVVFNLGDHNLVKCSHYTIRHGFETNNSFIQNWVFEGSLDNKNWDILHSSLKHQFTKGHDTKTFEIQPTNKYYQYFRILQKGNYYHEGESGAPLLCLNGFEIYGEVLIDPTHITHLTKPFLLPQYKMCRDFTYSHDFDSNGILHYLGTSGSTRQFDDSIINLKVSTEMQNIGHLLDKLSKDVVTISGSSPVWLQIDLEENWLKCDAFTLFNTSGLKLNIPSWVLQASHDEKNWIDLFSEAVTVFSENDKSKTYRIAPKSYYRYFRILSTINLWPFNGIELYGKSKVKMMMIEPPVIPKEGYKPRKKFERVEDLDTNGLFYWLGTLGNSFTYTNPALNKIVDISLSHQLVEPNMKSYDVISRDKPVDTFWGNTTPIWFCVDLGENCFFSCTEFTLRHGFSRPNSFLCNFELAASKDFVTWDILHCDVISPFRREFDTCSFKLQANSKFYRYFKVIQKGNYSMNPLNIDDSGQPLMCINGFELYGELEVSLDTPSRFLSYRLGLPLKNVPKTLMYAYSSDNERTGLLYWLGTEGLTSTYKAPSRRDIVKLKTSHEKPNGSDFHLIFSRDKNQELYWGGSSPQWFSIDIGEQNSFMCNAYTIRHGRSTSKSFLSNWQFQGSSDDNEWITLHSVEGTPFTKPFESMTFKIQPVKFLRYFRIIQNENSSGEAYMSIIGFELYGLKNYTIVKKQRKISKSMVKSLRAFKEILYYDQTFQAELIQKLKKSKDALKIECIKSIESIQRHHVQVPESIKSIDIVKIAPTAMKTKSSAKLEKKDSKKLSKEPKEKKKKKDCNVS